MATATVERPAATGGKPAGRAARKPLMKFRLLAGGFDQVDPALDGTGTAELRRRVLAGRDAGSGREGEDAEAERAAVAAMTRPELLKELGAYLRFRADSSTGFQPAVESDVDLEKKFGRAKFARLQEDSPPRVVEKRVPVDYEEMSLEELRAFAAEEEIELPADAGADKRRVIAAVRAARKRTSA